MAIIHESGHILDKRSPGLAYERIEASFSPTKYGRIEGPHEAFAEAFTYWVFDADLNPEAKEIVEATVKRWGEL